MRLTFSTDYVLRLLMLVGLESDRLVSVEEGADRFGISKKVAYQLGQAGYLENARGCNGGLRLGNAPRQIVVGEVVRENRTRLCGCRMRKSGGLLQDRTLLYTALCNGKGSPGFS
jgi:Rrf2 family transcriptional regulator, nitric oxide-sensitive transcriptional repressor